MARKSARAAAVKSGKVKAVFTGHQHSGLIDITGGITYYSLRALVLNSGVEENAETLDAAIEKCLKGWTLDRIARVDLAVLRVAVWELCHAKETPDAVVINEAVALAQKFDSPTAGKFVNGVLSTLLSQRNAGEKQPGENA